MTELAPAVDRLIARYRAPDTPISGGAAGAGGVAGSGGAAGPGDAAILARPIDVLAYAAYRMPATYAAVRAVLNQVAPLLPGPRRLVDLGGGTGAAIWAASDVLSTLTEVTVLDRVPAALQLGRRLAAARPALARVQWQEWMYRPDGPLPVTDLITVSYLLGELAEPARTALVMEAARRAAAVVVVEPGTPAGYGRVLAARDALLAAGLHVVAPCPHQARCPLPAGDWCHFAVRVNRSALHRQAKGATLGYEDEKFAYVVAVQRSVPTRAPARVLRRPAYGRGLVRLRLCTPDGVATDTIVSKRQGERYRAARDVAWGDAWPVH